MNEKIIEMIVHLVEQGGQTAVYVFGIYILGSILKFAIGFGCILAGILKLCKTLRYIYENKTSTT